MGMAIRIMIIFVTLLVAIILFAAGFKDVNDGYMAVEVCKIGKLRVLDEPLPSGWYWRRPLMVYFVQYNMRDREIGLGEMSLNTKDSKWNINIQSILYYQLQKEKLVALHKLFGSDYEIENKVRTAAKAHFENIVSAFYRAEVFGDKRETVRTTIFEALKKEFTDMGITIRDLKFTDVYFPNDYRTTMNQYPTVITGYDFTQECLTKEKSKVYVDGTADYYIESKNAEFVYYKLGDNFKDFMKTKMAVIVHSVCSLFTPDEIFSGETRKNVTAEILKQARAEFESYKIVISDVNFKSVRFPEKYQQELENIQNIKQEIEKSKLLLDKEKEDAKIKMFKEEQEGQRKLLAAKMESDAEISKAKAYKDAEIIRAEGKAESLLKIQKIITESPKLMQYMFIEKISDKVKVIIAPSKDGNFMLDSEVKSAIITETPKKE